MSIVVIIIIIFTVALHCPHSDMCCSSSHSTCVVSYRQLVVINSINTHFFRFLVSYIPGGTTGLTFMAKLFSRLCTSTLSSAIDA